MNAPPPPYSTDSSLRLLYHNRGLQQPFQPWLTLDHLYWTTNDRDVAYDIHCDELSSLISSKYAIYRGNAGASPPAFIYNQTMSTLRDETANNKTKCDFKRLKNNQSTTLEFKHNKANLKWVSSQPLSTVHGNTFDTTQYICSDTNGTQLASFSFLSLDGQLDTRILLTQAGSQVLPMEIALVTLSILLIEQWGDMRRQAVNSPMAARISTLRNVQANFTQGRLITYALERFEDIEDIIADIQAEADRRIAQPGGGSGHDTSGTSTMISVASASSAMC